MSAADWMNDWQKRHEAYKLERAAKMANVPPATGEALANLYAERNLKNIKDAHITKFKETYIKLRTDNIVLDHRTAIELAKMIYAEADTITYEDTQ